MRRRRVHTGLWNPTRAEKHARDQPSICNAAREIAAAAFESSPRNSEGVAGNVAVPAKDPVETLVEVGNDDDVGFIVASARFDPCLPLAHLVRGSQVRIPIAAANFQTTEFVD